MTELFKVLAPGLHTTVQDRGRWGFQDIGMPVSGALDRVAFRLANALVGNPDGTPALEILLQGPTLEVVAESARVALVGGGAGLEIGDETPRSVPPGESVRLVRGDILRVRPLGDVSCAYLAVEGGIAVPPCLGSASTYVRGRIGGLEGRPLQAGDVLAGARPSVEERPERALASPFDPGFGQSIRVVLGPQEDYFTAEAVALFLSSDYRVSAQADRMGFRLDGPVLAHAKGFDIVSDAIVSGSVQVPGSGQPIVLLADAQTTGGYPKIATVISTDVPVLARRRPGMAVRFEAVTQEQAEALRREEEARVRGWIADVRLARRGGGVDVETLYSANLIDGMIDALA